MDEDEQTTDDETDEDFPSLERQAELEALYQKNVANGVAPYHSVAIRTNGELQWVMMARNWLSESDLEEEPELVNLSGAWLWGANLSEMGLNRANLSNVFVFGASFASASLDEANLSGAFLEWVDFSKAKAGGADFSGASLDEANLSGAYLEGADFSDAHMEEVNLSGAFLVGADLPRADLERADFSGADLTYANLSGAYLKQSNLVKADLTNANLSGVDLRECRWDNTTALRDATFSSATSMVDIVWNDVALMRVSWKTMPTLGDEAEARRRIDESGKPKDRTARLTDYLAAARAYRQLAVALHNQGMNEDADRFAYRAQLMQCEIFRWSKQWGGFLFSWFLFLISGYGYRLWRILATYAVVLGVFTFIYWAIGVHSFSHESGIQALWDSFLVSLSAIHGRTTFEQLGAWSPAAWTAAVESVFGIVVEGVFVAMLIQRFFAR